MLGQGHVVSLLADSLYTPPHPFQWTHSHNFNAFVPTPTCRAAGDDAVNATTTTSPFGYFRFDGLEIRGLAGTFQLAATLLRTRLPADATPVGFNPASDGCPASVDVPYSAAPFNPRATGTQLVVCPLNPDSDAPAFFVGSAADVVCTGTYSLEQK